MDERERNPRVREWIGPWMQNWPEKHVEAEKRARLQAHLFSEHQPSHERAAEQGTSDEDERRFEVEVAIAALRALVEAVLSEVRACVARVEQVVGDSPTLGVVADRPGGLRQFAASQDERDQRDSDTTTAHYESPENEHLLLVPTTKGYRLCIREGVLPRSGETLFLPEGRFRILRRGPSPLPADPRRCLFLEAAASEPLPSERSADDTVGGDRAA